MTIAFDADVLIYAAAPSHPLGAKVARLFDSDPDDSDPESTVGVGSLLLLTEVLAKPMRADPESDETADLAGLLVRLDLRPVDEATAKTALALAVRYGLSAADAVHLATAVVAGADWFLTNNRRDFPPTISEVNVIYPDDLPLPGATGE